MKNSKKTFRAILIVGVLSLLAVSMYLGQGLKEGAAMAIGPVYPSNLPNGDYVGTYDGGRWSNTVNVTVKEGKITAIGIEKTVAVEKPEITTQLIDRVIAKQNTNVDVVSGATVSCKAYLKAIENALVK